MKYLVILAFAMSLMSCKNETTETKRIIENTTETEQKETYKSFGKEIISDDAIAVSSMLNHYKDLKIGDSLDTKITAKVLDVCQAKGCWMVLDLGEEKTARVKFKDYGFFMPKDIKGKEVIVNGKAFVNEMPVEELQHYAKDAGQTEEEIAAITSPEKTFSFLADGVLLKQ